MNDINLEEFKTDYNKCMLAEDMMTKYNINYYYFKKLKRILKLDRGGKIGKLEYILKNNYICNELDKPDKPDKPDKKETIKSILKPNKPNKLKHKQKTNINIKTIETDEGTPEYEIKKCDTTYNNDKSKLLDALKLSTETLNKINSKKK
jgi:hypothetical protein